eukprot:10150804-Heterocapsa_arctica.AAC.1
MRLDTKQYIDNPHKYLLSKDCDIADLRGQVHDLSVKLALETQSADGAILNERFKEECCSHYARG